MPRPDPTVALAVMTKTLLVLVLRQMKPGFKVEDRDGLRAATMVASKAFLEATSLSDSESAVVIQDLENMVDSVLALWEK